jgi:hypothetical protein
VFTVFKYLSITFFIFSIITVSYSQESSLSKKGTTIVYVIRNDTIWIGVDSKIIGEKNGNPIDSVTCKIIKVNNIVFTHAGLY